MTQLTDADKKRLRTEKPRSWREWWYQQNKPIGWKVVYRGTRGLKYGPGGWRSRLVWWFAVLNAWWLWILVVAYLVLLAVWLPIRALYRWWT